MKHKNKRHTRITNKKTRKHKGGALCRISIQGDIYTKGDPYFTIINEETGEPYPATIFNDTQNPNVVIKKIYDDKEYLITRFISSLKYGNDYISPRVYGFFDCNPTYDPNVLDDSSDAYMVMEKLKGLPLNTAPSKAKGIANIKAHIDDIFNINNMLYDRGIVLNDLYPRNIIITPENKVKFIDFDDLTTVMNPDHTAIPLADRMTKEMLLKQLIEDFDVRYSYEKDLTIYGSKGGKRKRRRTTRRL